MVPKNRLNLAFGFSYSTKSTVQTILPLIVGLVQDFSKEYKLGYFYSEIALTTISAFMVILGRYVYTLDRKLNNSALALL